MSELNVKIRIIYTCKYTAVTSGTFKGFVRVEIRMLVCERVRSLEVDSVCQCVLICWENELWRWRIDLPTHLRNIAKTPSLDWSFARIVTRPPPDLWLDPGAGLEYRTLYRNDQTNEPASVTYSCMLGSRMPQHNSFVSLCDEMINPIHRISAWYNTSSGSGGMVVVSCEASARYCGESANIPRCRGDPRISVSQFMWAHQSHQVDVIICLETISRI